jgi:glycosyl hydrolase family 113/HEAT repeat protein
LALTVRGLALLAAAFAAVLVHDGCRTRKRDPEAAALAAELKKLYAPVAGPGARWRARATLVRLPDGREVRRDEAYRDAPRFPDACRLLLGSREGDDAPLAAWLAGTLPAARAREATTVLIEALDNDDSRAAFEAARALERIGTSPALPALERAAQRAGAPEVRTAARLALEEIRGRESADPKDPPEPSPRPWPAESPAVPGPPAGLPPSFARGVSWWWSESGPDAGATSFRRLRALGVTAVSIHTWDPRQRSLQDPALAEPGHRFALRNLDAIVASAHAAGLKAMLKPHLEMRGYEPTPEERRIFREGDEAARSRLLAQLESRVTAGDMGNHNHIEMRTEADWRRWFREYEDYLLPYAEAARAAGVDAFCVGRELDTTVRLREGDWRQLIAKVRKVFPGPLTYSANFDTWSSLGFWDALDFIGVSAYFPLSDRPDPSVEELEEAWARALGPLEEASKRFGRPVLLTEAGFPSVADAARAPWREGRPPVDVWRQARCYEATLRALAARPWIVGAYFWLWERPAEPPFRDPSHALPGKPAAYVMARWYRTAAPP